MNTTRSLPVLRTLCGIAVLAAAAALPLNSEAATLTLYNAQHEQVVAALAKDFEKQTGVSVKVRNGEGPAMAAQLVAEGSASPADVYFTENSPELMLLDEKGLLAKTDASTLDHPVALQLAAGRLGRRART